LNFKTLEELKAKTDKLRWLDVEPSWKEMINSSSLDAVLVSSGAWTNMLDDPDVSKHVDPSSSHEVLLGGTLGYFICPSTKNRVLLVSDTLFFPTVRAFPKDKFAMCSRELAKRIQASLKQFSDVAEAEQDEAV